MDLLHIHYNDHFLLVKHFFLQYPKCICQDDFLFPPNYVHKHLDYTHLHKILQTSLEPIHLILLLLLAVAEYFELPTEILYNFLQL